MIRRGQLDQKKRKLSLREERQGMVFRFGELLENNKKGFHDIKTLPHAKMEILAGFLNAISNSQTELEIKIYSSAALGLAFYQEDVGEKSFVPYNTEGRDPTNFTQIELLQFVEKAREDQDKVTRLNAALSDDLEFISTLSGLAKTMNPHIRPVYEKWWDKFRQQGFYSPWGDGFVDAAEQLLP